MANRLLASATFAGLVASFVLAGCGGSGSTNANAPSGGGATSSTPSTTASGSGAAFTIAPSELKWVYGRVNIWWAESKAVKVILAVASGKATAQQQAQYDCCLLAPLRTLGSYGSNPPKAGAPTPRLIPFSTALNSAIVHNKKGAAALLVAFFALSTNPNKAQKAQDIALSEFKLGKAQLDKAYTLLVADGGSKAFDPSTWPTICEPQHLLDLIEQYGFHADFILTPGHAAPGGRIRVLASCDLPTKNGFQGSMAPRRVELSTQDDSRLIVVPFSVAGPDDIEAALPGSIPAGTYYVRVWYRQNGHLWHDDSSSTPGSPDLVHVSGGGGKPTAPTRPATTSSGPGTDTDFWLAVNFPLGQVADADQAAHSDLAISSSRGPGGQLEADGRSIVAAADAVAAKLRSMSSRLTPAQAGYTRAILPLAAAERSYGLAVEQYARQGGDPRAVEAAARATLGTVNAAARALPHAQLPSPLSLEAATTIPTTPVQTTTNAPVTTTNQAAPTATTAPSQPTASEYTHQVDTLLASSGATLERVKALVPSVTSHRLAAGAAIAEAQAFVNARATALRTALQLHAPPAFARSQALLVQSLRLSGEDDEALLAWVRAYENGGNAQAELDRVSSIGTETSAAKRQFLAVYGPARQNATGQPASSLPTDY